MNAAVIAPAVVAATGELAIENVAVVVPAEITMLGVTAAAGLLEVSAMVVSAAAGALRVTVPLPLLPPVRLAGVTLTESMDTVAMVITPRPS